MSTFAGGDFTSFRNVNARGYQSAGIPGMFAIQGNSGNFFSTVSLSTTTLDQNFAINFPNKSGTMGVTGTFSVDVQAVAATTYSYSTIVTVSGIRAEDALIVVPSAVASNFNQSARILQSATASNGSITLNFLNIGQASNASGGNVFTYTSAR